MGISRLNNLYFVGMKNIYASFLLISLFFITGYGCKTMNECQDNEVKFYQATGMWYKQGKYTGNFKDCKLDGVWTWYYDNGQKHKQMTFVNGIAQDTLYEWYSEGSRKRIIPFNNGKKEGKGIEWKPNGSILSTVEYVNGQQHGKYCTYYPNGTLNIERTFRNDSLINVKEYYESGNTLSDTDYKDFLRSGKEILWHENGVKASEAHFDNGHPVNIMRSWHPNGQLKFEAYFNNKGLMDGSWVEYDDKGNKVKERLFKNGQLIEEKVYNNLYQ